MAIPNYEKDNLYEEVGMRRMKDSYLCAGETSPQERIAKVCNIFGTDDDHRKRLYNYASDHWLSLSSPLLGYDDADKYSYPISCYLCYIPDNLPAIISTLTEVNHLSVCGGGVGIKIGLRSPDKKSMGALVHARTYDTCVLAYKQGSRRGSYALFLDIDHPEIVQFIEMRKPTGDYNMRCLNIHHAVNLSDKFMNIIKKCSVDSTYNDDWPLIDPHSGVTKEVVSAKMLWQLIIETRMHTGEPFMCFIDTCNAQMNPYQKARGLKIQQSNLCTEVIVPTDENRSSLCCLASVNMEYYDDWKGNKQFIGDVMEMLDNVLNTFINKAQNSQNPQLFDRILESAIKEKNIGIGVLGFHAYLQQKLIAFESEDAVRVNEEVFSWIRSTSDEYNKILGGLRGTPEDIEGSGNRFAYTIAVAPNATTSIIMGNTSPSIEPYRANIYRQDTLSGSQYNKNKYLEKLFVSKGFGPKLRTKIWTSITINDGSVQHLSDNLLTREEKDIFKTFIEIDQMKVIELAADRQKYIDQGQSINLTFNPDVNVSILHKVHLAAWEKGIKTLYYCRSAKISRADKLVLEDPLSNACVSCQS